MIRSLQSKFFVGACGLGLLAALALSGCVDSSSAEDEGLEGTDGSTSCDPTKPLPWVNLYYPGWTQGRMPPSEIDYTAVTQIIHFAWIPVIENGVLVIDDEQNGVQADAATAAIEAGHAAGKTVTIAVGGAGAGSTYFNEAITDEFRATFIQMIVELAKTRGYDGIDIDMELFEIDPTNFRKFSRELREYMDANAKGMSLTCAVLGSQGSLYGPLGDVYDQVNIMTYDLVYGVDQSWFDAPLYGAGQFYSVERSAQEYAGAGVPPERIGTGVKFGGYIYEGVDGPRQPTSSSPRSIPYRTVMEDYYSEAAYHWDEAAKVPYLSLPDNGGTYISYDDADSIVAKISYMKNKCYGGLILWDASDAYFADEPAGQRLPLLQVVKDEAFATE